MPLSFKLKLEVLCFGKKFVEILHAILEDLKLISGQKFRHKSCRILILYESGHKDHLIWIYNEQVMAILVKLVKTDEHESDPK